MNNIIKRLRDKFMSESNLRQSGLYSICGLFTKNKTRISEFKATGESRYIYINELDKVCFQHDIAYRDFKELPRRATSDNVLHDKAFEIASNTKYSGYQWST